jgi:hypothetical protein
VCVCVCVWEMKKCYLRRNCLLQQVIEGKIKGLIEVTRRRGRRRKKLLDDLKDRRRYCQLKEEALDRTMWRNNFGKGFGPVVWQITDDDDDDDDDLPPTWQNLATLEGGSCTNIWPFPEAVVTVLCTPDDGCGWHPKHVEWTCRTINRLLSVASR